MLTNKGTFKLQTVAINYFQKLPDTIQAEIVEKACIDVGWDTSFTITIPAWAKATNKNVKYDIKNYYTNNISGNTYENVLHNYGHFLSVHTGHTILSGCIVRKGITLPQKLTRVDSSHSFNQYNNKLKVHLNKFLKQKLPKILMDNYPEYMI